MILPYCEVDGIRTITDSDMRHLYVRICDEGSARTVFYDGSIMNEDQWLQYFKHGSSKLFIISNKNKEQVAMCWLNSFDQYTAQGHWVAFKDHFNRETIQLGRDCVQQLLGIGYKTFTGIVPVSNKLGNRLMSSVMTKLGTIPNHCYLHYEDRFVDGNIYYIERKEI